MRLKNFTTLLLLSSLCISCYNQSKNCKDFKTGTFLFEQEINGNAQKSTFIRTKDYEIETYNNKVDTSSIRWINDCEYILQKINPKSIEEQKAVHIKILSTNNSDCVFEFGLVGSEEKKRGVLKKLN